VGLDPSVYVHPAGLCESDRVGPRTRVWAFAHVLPGAEIGADCNVCDHAFIEGGAKLGDRVTVKNAVLVWDKVTVEDDVFLGPNMVFTNALRPRAGRRLSRAELLPTLVRRGATIGANATIVCGITIGMHAFVAAGSVVAADVPDHALVAGNPARHCGWVCACGERLDGGFACSACGRSYAPAEAAAGETAGLVPIPRQ
jgi:acetyltransferase-like isoleucine patch superfamily enzyme